ncbi:MAG: SUMF1/EgtB/PvdO family nonheme iron enzyme [Treponema sp.]|nr:SUMF1/EgtB/PvdO family nonheme iron enzyme [Treponema sp.]MCL2237042.1 SUMF1/EgtB/PvdO family nonheme iron enzyme [Treponema sp.]
MQDKQDNNEIQVKLKPFMGMRPGVYLTILYSFILLIIIFFLFFSHGLKNPGSVLIVKTDPKNAAIRVDGVYKGLSGSRIFVPKGTHIIEAAMPGFESQSAQHTIGARIFASRFFPRKYEISFTLHSNDPVQAFADYASDFAQWTFAGEPTANWQVPMSLSEGAERLGRYANEGTNREEFEGILRAASRFASTRASLRDLVRAKILIDNNGNAPTPLSMVGSISDMLAFLSESNTSPYWLSNLFPSDSPVASQIENSDWYKNMNERISSAAIAVNPAVRGQVRYGGLTFIDINLGGSFRICDTFVPKSLFETFLNENEEWRAHHTNYAPDEITINPFENTNPDAVTGMTWYSAKAFCEWFTIRYLPAGLRARLPFSREWESAAWVMDGFSNPGWEWCEDAYTPNYFAAPKEAIEKVGSPERVLRGRPITGVGAIMASMPSDLSSPIISFRIAIDSL